MYSIKEIYKGYKSTFQNYISVLFYRTFKKNKIKIKLNNNKICYWNYKQVKNYHYLYNKYLQCYPNCNITNLTLFNTNLNALQFNYKGIEIQLYGSLDNGDIVDVFLHCDYSWLNSNNKIVLDIGANIGDSSIYFALNNAKKVIALEPYPYSYNYALKNININNLNDKITLLNAGYGEDSEIKVDENKITDAGTDLKPSKNGKNIKLYSLKTLINEYNLNNEDLLLKMDCEGCEYNLLNEDNDVLRKFKRIQIEYHYGYDKLINKLKACNFKVQFTQPKKIKEMSLGWIYAEL